MQGEIIYVGRVQSLILGDDGVKYMFTLLGWRNDDISPEVGLRVDFDVEGREAANVEPFASTVPASTVQSKTGPDTPLGRGEIINVGTGQRLILGDDGSRYMFTPLSWEADDISPEVGMRVGFKIQGTYAVGVYPISGGSTPVVSVPVLQGIIRRVAGAGRQGLIKGDEGVQYTFTPGDWEGGSSKPAAGMRVHFVARGSLATSLRPVQRRRRVSTEPAMRPVTKPAQSSGRKPPDPSQTRPVRRPPEGPNANSGRHPSTKSDPSSQSRLPSRIPPARRVRSTRTTYGVPPTRPPIRLKKGTGTWKTIALALLVLAVVGAAIVFYFERASEDYSATYAAAYAERIDAGSSEEYARAYAVQIDAGFSKRYAYPYAQQIEAGRSDTYAQAYAERSANGESSKDAGAYAEQMEAGHLHWYAEAYVQNIRLGESPTDARAYAELVDGVESSPRAYAGQVDVDNENSEQTLNATVVLAMFSTVDDTEADERATSVLEMTIHVGRGDMDNDTVLGLLNDIAPDASISERKKAADRLASISDDSGGQLTPQQSMQVANELTRLMTGHGIDAEQRKEAAREMVRLSQAGELNAENATELMDAIAPEWSVEERREALGYLAWQFAHGDWDADSAKRTAEEGYTLITGGEIQLEKRMEAGVELVGEGLKRYGGDGYDDESVDQATALIKETISGDLSTESVSNILGLDVGKSSANSNTYDSDAYRDVYNRRYGELRKMTKTIDHPALPSPFTMSVQAYSSDQASASARIYAGQIVDGKSDRYAKGYSRLIADGKPVRFARVYSGLIDVGKSGRYANAFAEQIIADSSVEYAHTYAQQIHFKKREEDAEAYAHAYTQQMGAGKSKGHAQTYAEQIVAGKSEEYAHTFAQQRGAGRSYSYADGYARARVIGGMDDLSAHAYAHALVPTPYGYSPGYSGPFGIYAEQIGTGRPERYAHSYAEQIAAGKWPTYARTYAKQIAAGRSPTLSSIYAWAVDLKD